MPPIKKIIRDAIDAHHARHETEAQKRARLAIKSSIKSVIASARELHHAHHAPDGVKRERARALDGDDKEARRQTILDAAERLFGERHALANVADVAEAAGLAKGTVYLYFQTKEEIYLALHLRHAAIFFTTLIARMERPEPFLFSEMMALADTHLLKAPTYMPLGALCIGFSENAVPLAAATDFQMNMTRWLLAAGGGLERHFTKLAPGEGVRLLMHSYAIMTGLYSLQGAGPSDPKCPVTPGMGTYQEEAALAVTRYWAHVAGVADTRATTRP